MLGIWTQYEERPSFRLLRQEKVNLPFLDH